MEDKEIQWRFSNGSYGIDDYFSKTINHTSLAGIDQLTNIFLNSALRSHDILPDSISQNFSSFNFLLGSGNNETNFNDTVSALKTHWYDILLDNGLFLGMFLFGIIAALLLPIAGTIVLIKKYCCSCLKKNPKPLRKHAQYIFWVQGTTVLLLLAMGWIGVGWLNGSNLALDRGISELPKNTKGFVKFINNIELSYFNIILDE